MNEQLFQFGQGRDGGGEISLAGELAEDGLGGDLRSFLREGKEGEPERALALGVEIGRVEGGGEDGKQGGLVDDGGEDSASVLGGIGFGEGIVEHIFYCRGKEEMSSCALAQVGVRKDAGGGRPSSPALLTLQGEGSKSRLERGQKSGLLPGDAEHSIGTASKGPAPMGEAKANKNTGCDRCFYLSIE